MAESNKAKQQQDDEATFSSETTVMASNKTNLNMTSVTTRDMKNNDAAYGQNAQNCLMRNPIIRQYVQETADFARRLRHPFLRRIYIWRRRVLFRRVIRIDAELARELFSLTPEDLAQDCITTNVAVEKSVFAISAISDNSLYNQQQQRLETIIEETAPPQESSLDKIEMFVVTTPTSTNNKISPAPNERFLKRPGTGLSPLSSQCLDDY